MTREEAIKILKAISVYECYPKSASKETKEAIDMAIESLQKDIERHEMVIRASERHLGIVRCKDCRFNKHPSNDLCLIKKAGIYLDDDDFCSYGERKGGEE